MRSPNYLTSILCAVLKLCAASSPAHGNAIAGANVYAGAAALTVCIAPADDAWQETPAAPASQFALDAESIPPECISAASTRVST